MKLFLFLPISERTSLYFKYEETIAGLRRRGKTFLGHGVQNVFAHGNDWCLHIGVLRGGGQGGLAPPPLKLVKV